MYNSPPLTEPEIIHQAWRQLHAAGEYDNIASQAKIERLQSLLDLLGRRQFDPAFTTDFYQALGPQFTALLPKAISLAAWSDNHRTAGEPTLSVDRALMNADTSLAVASPKLETWWRDELFKGAVHDGVLDDSFPLLFAYGQYAAPFAQPAGQLGLDALHGKITVDRGVGSPGYPGFDVLQTDWAERGRILVAAAGRTPDAANALLLVPENANWLTDDKFGRRDRAGRHPPDWAVIDGAVRDLIVSATVWEGRTHPELARRAAANVINGANAARPGDASKALAPAYGEMVLTYLPDFARSPGFNMTAESRGDYISIGAMQAAQFTSLAMHDDPSKAAIFKMRDALDLQTVVVGLESGSQMFPPRAQRMANVDGILLTAENGEVFVSAREKDAQAKRYNEDIDMLQSFGMGIIGLAAFPGSGVVDTVIDKGFEKLKTDVLYHDTNHAEAAGVTTNVANYSAFDHERLVIAEGRLIVDVRAEQEAATSGATLSSDQLAYIRHAEEMLGTPYVDALCSAANGHAVAPVAVDSRHLIEWAGNTPLDNGFTDVSNYTDLILPQDGSSLWPH
jgi:hypothetical protein